MSGILLTKDTTFIIGPVAEILGLIMNAIFNFLNLIVKQNTIIIPNC